MNWIKRLIMSLQFLTKIPIPITIEFNEEDFGKCVVLSPLVGVLLGAILALMYFLFSFLFPPIIVGFICLIIYVFLTGGLHLDGLGDTFDGVFSYGGLGLYIIIFVFAFMASNFFSRKIGGVSGDIIGCVVELSQLAYLISLFLLYRGGLL